MTEKNRRMWETVQRLKNLLSNLALLVMIATLTAYALPLRSKSTLQQTHLDNPIRLRSSLLPHVSPLSPKLEGTDSTHIPAPLGHYRYDLSMHDQFRISGKLRRNVEFWIRVFTQFYTHQGILHDTEYPDIVYEIVNLKEFETNDRSKEAVLSERRAKWRKVLRSVHEKMNYPGLMDSDELHVHQLFSRINDPQRFLKAANKGRMRIQMGLRDRFIQAIRVSGRYLPEMERIFRDEGLPLDLTRLPFVESSFDIRAKSKVGASGVWQFMPDTGKRFLRISHAIDERNDPITATRAAARLLKDNFDTLRSWPLAVVAYNHGRKGMERAIAEVGSRKLEAITRLYKSPSFGFASKNFFLSLVAAIEVERNAEYFFGRLERESPLEGDVVGLADYIGIRDLCAYLGLSIEKLQILNPALNEGVFDGTLRVPRGYRLRIPSTWGREHGGAKEAFWMRYLKIPSGLKYRRQKGKGEVRISKYSTTR